jgi:hypothetical protein
MENQVLKSKKQPERGSTLVEASLIFVLGMGLLIGMFDLGQMLFLQQTVVERTRYAARWAAVNAYDSDQITNMVLYGTPTAPPSGTPLFNMSASNVTVAHDTADGLFADRITVTVSGYSYLFFSGAIVNTMYGNGSSAATSVVRTGLTASETILHEYVPDPS